MGSLPQNLECYENTLIFLLQYRYVKEVKLLVKINLRRIRSLCLWINDNTCSNYELRCYIFSTYTTYVGSTI